MRKITRILSVLLSVILVLTSVPVVIGTAETSEDDFVYRVLETGTAKITNYLGSDTDVVIPSEIDGYIVTEIGNDAFENDELTSVTIPDSVEIVDEGAFSDCDFLTNIAVDEENLNYSNDEYGVLFNKDKTELIQYPIGNERTEYSIPESVTSIGDYAFMDCKSLTNVEIPDSVTSIDYSAFFGCASLISVTIPESVTYIDDLAFHDCTSLVSITVDENNQDYSSDEYGVLFNKDKTVLIQYPAGNKRTEYSIPDGVINIGVYAFEDCASLTSVTIPDSVISIDISAFRGCTSLTSVTIPDSVTSIDDSAFKDCASLTSITVDKNNQDYSSDECGALFNKDKTVLIQYPAGNKRTEYSIPDSVTDIGYETFSDCGSLTSITIPGSVTNIGSGTFHNCTSLTSVTIPDGVINIGYAAFSDCASLASVTIEDGVTSIGDYAFSDCASLTSVTIPGSVTSIGDNAFYDCASLTSVTIPDSVTSIGEYAFENCTSLTSVTIPGSVTNIGSGTFHNCTSLTSVTIPASVTSIGDDAFWGCVSITSVTIPNSVTSIGDWAFAGCYSLATIAIPESVTSIGEYAFGDCDSLTSVTIPASVTSIGDDAFSGCDSLESITVDKNNQNYSSDEYGVLFNKDKTELLQYPAGNKRTEYSIPDGVTDIGYYAFYGCASLKNITIPGSITIIGDYAFENCASLTSVTIPESVTSIGDRAFIDCTSLTSVTIPESVTDIGDMAFGYYYTTYSTIYSPAPEANRVEGFTIYGIPGSAAETYAVDNGFTFIDITSEESTGEQSKPNDDIIKGDLDGDGYTTAYDARMVLRISARLEFSTENQLRAADMNGDDMVTASDARAVLSVSALLEENTDAAPPRLGLDPETPRSDKVKISITSSEKIEEGEEFKVAVSASGAKGLTAGNIFLDYDNAALEFNYAEHIDNGKTTIFRGDKIGDNRISCAFSCVESETEDNVELFTITFKALKDSEKTSVSYKIVSWYGTDIPNDGEKELPCVEDYHPGSTDESTTHSHYYCGVLTKEATCTEEGEMTYNCFFCDYSYTEAIPANGHTPGDWETVVPPEVGKAGLEQRRCTVCGEVLEEREIPELPGSTGNCVVLPDPPDPSTEPEYSLGDVNADGDITASDARIALRISAKLHTPTETEALSADADKNGSITASDARNILRVSAKLEQ